MKRHEVGRAIHSNLGRAGYGNPAEHGSATRAMMGAAQFAVDKHHTAKRKGAKSGDARPPSLSNEEKREKRDPKVEENRAVACKILDAISGIIAHHSDPNDVGSSEIIRATAKGHAGRDWY